MAPTWLPVLWCRVVAAAYMSTSLTGYEVDWSTTATELTLMLRVQTTGWLGFGISASGSMAGSDIVTVNGAGAVDDAHVLDTNAKPVSDQCQHWTLVSRSVTNGTTSVTLKRMLDTGDPQDHKIENNGLKSRVIMAFSKTGTVDSSVTYHQTSRGFTQIDFFKTTVQQGNTFPSTGAHFTFHAYNPSVPSNPFPIPQTNPSGPSQGGTTMDTYIDICMDVPASVIGNQDVFVTEIWPEITVGHELKVHHFLVYASTQTCSQMGNALDKSTLIWPYGGPGTTAMIFPSQAGFRLSSNGYKSLVNNIHYFNVNQQAGLMDRSGPRLYYTTQARPNDVGVMNVADVSVVFASIPSKQSIKFGTSPLSQDKFECTIASLSPTESVTVFGVHQHMHADGFAFRSDVVDNGGNLKFKVHQDFYRGEFQDFKYLANPSTFTKGDKVTLKCIFNTGAMATTGLQTYGASSRNEMCMGWFFYYPRKGSSLDMECDYSQNASVYVGKTGLTVAQLNRSFGVNGACVSTVTSTSAPSVSTVTSTSAPSVSTSAPSALTAQTNLAFRIEAPILCMILYVVSTAILESAVGSI